MKRVALAAIGILLIPVPAAAQSTEDVATALIDDGYYIDPDAVPVDASSLSALHRDTAGSGHPVYPIILGQDPVGGATGFTRLVMDSLGEGTVVVLTDSLAVGVESQQYDTAAINAALDEADAGGGDNLTYLRAFIAALTDIDVSAGTGTATGSGGGGGSAAGFLILIGVVAAIVVAVVVVMRRGRKTSLATQRRRIRKVLVEMADDILDLSDRVEGNPEAKEHYVEGSAGYTDAAEKLDQAGSGDDLAGLMRPLLDSAWHLDAAEALVDGKPMPPHPAPAPSPATSTVTAPPTSHVQRPTPGSGSRATRVLSMLGSVLGASGTLSSRGRPSRPRWTVSRRRSASRGSASRFRRGTTSRGRAGRRRRG
ncbi:MAG: hypothetical protein ACE5E8_06700 [Acidimicrobiia bacterium]